MHTSLEIFTTVLLASTVYGQVATLCRSDERLLACGGCQATCRVPAPACAAVCREGCYCAPGLLRNDTGHCVPLSECPFTTLGHQEETSEPRAQDQLCPENEEYRFCEVCNRTCGNPDPVCPAQCARGCFCKRGLLRDESSGRCVEPRSCQNALIAPPVPSCPANEEYRICEPCSRSCARRRPVCPAQCARGCFCKDGLLRNSRGLCVVPQLCDASETTNLVVPQLDAVAVCGERQEYRRCGCERTCLERHGACGACSAGCFCAGGWLRADDGRCIAEYECPQDKCPNPEEVYECRSTCEEGCNGESECHDRGRGCTLGCYCRPGLLRDFKAGRCVERRHCVNTTTVY